MSCQGFVTQFESLEKKTEPPNSNQLGNEVFSQSLKNPPRGLEEVQILRFQIRGSFLKFAATKISNP